MQETTPVTSHTLIRQAFAEHQSWIEQRLGCSLTDTVLVRTHSISSQLHLAVLGHSDLTRPRSREMEAVHRELEHVALPPGMQPIVDLHERMNDSAEREGELDAKRHPQALTWACCPVAFRLRCLPSELVAARVIRFGVIHEAGESTGVTLEKILFQTPSGATICTQEVHRIRWKRAYLSRIAASCRFGTPIEKA